MTLCVTDEGNVQVCRAWRKIPKLLEVFDSWSCNDPKGKGIRPKMWPEELQTAATITSCYEHVHVEAN